MYYKDSSKIIKLEKTRKSRKGRKTRKFREIITRSTGQQQSDSS